VFGGGSYLKKVFIDHCHGTFLMFSSGSFMTSDLMLKTLILFELIFFFNTV
jgi:hypothetical protein